MRRGYIKLYRKLLDNPVACADGDHLAVWVYLLMSATRAPIKAKYGGEIIDLLPGQLLTSRREIAEVLKISDSKIKRVLQSLKKNLHIATETDHQQTLITVLKWSKYQEETSENDGKLSQKSDQRNDQQIDQRIDRHICLEDISNANSKKYAGDQRNDQRIDQRVTNDLFPNHSIIKQEIKNYSNKARAHAREEESDLSICDVRFDKFWSAYPRKVSKKAAQKSWERIKPTDELFGRIMASLEKAKATYQWTKNNGEFIPHPATWLNQERWNDEYDTPPGGISPEWGAGLDEILGK